MKHTPIFHENQPKILDNDLDQAPETGAVYQERLNSMKDEIKQAFIEGNRKEARDTTNEVNKAFAHREKIPYSPLTEREVNDGYYNIRFNPQEYISNIAEVLNEHDEHTALHENMPIYRIDGHNDQEAFPLGVPATYVSNELGDTDDHERWIYLGKGKFTDYNGIMSPHLQKKIGHLINTDGNKIGVWAFVSAKSFSEGNVEA